MNQFCLPSPQTLMLLVKEINPAPGIIKDSFLTLLRKKVTNFSDENKICTLCVDEISIKANFFYNKNKDIVVGVADKGNGERTFEPATSATVLMARGIRSQWKQPLAYIFTKSGLSGTNLKQIIEEVICQLQSLNLKVVALVSDMGSNNILMAQKLNVCEENPYFYVQEQKIVYLFDTPHLLKALRNMLLKYNFSFQKNIISWDYLHRFYNQEKKFNTRAAPKLTDSHLNPSNFEKMKVRFAAQVFSSTVAAGLSLYIRFGAIPAEAAATAEFVERIDKLFDILNSSKIKGKRFNRAFKGLNYQTHFLKDSLFFF